MNQKKQTKIQKMLDEMKKKQAKIKTKQTKYEKLLDEFIEQEREKSRMGSGDDMFYEQQIIDYIDKQSPFWITFIKFIEKKTKRKVGKK